MFKRLLAATVVIFAMFPGIANAADNLSLHERRGLQSLVASQSQCLDCEKAPNFKSFRWRFASDFGNPNGAEVAYVVATYKDLAGGRYATLFLYDYFMTARWHLLQSINVDVVLDGKNEFSCGTTVLANPNYRIAAQLRVLKKVAKCYGG